MALCRNKAGKQAVSLYVTRLRHVKTRLRGEDLIKMGYRTGPIFQTMLNHLLEKKLDGDLRTREDEIKLLEKEYPLLSGDQKNRP